MTEDGREALEIMQKALSDKNDSTVEIGKAAASTSTPTSPFHVIFMDIQMPRMDGIQATREICGLGFDLPIVALTAFTDESNREACSNVGMQDFLPKPIKRPNLKVILAKIREELKAELETSTMHPAE